MGLQPSSMCATWWMSCFADSAVGKACLRAKHGMIAFFSSQVRRARKTVALDKIGQRRFSVIHLLPMAAISISPRFLNSILLQGPEPGMRKWPLMA